MSKWKLEREIADKAFEMMIKTWTDSGIASDQALQAARGKLESFEYQAVGANISRRGFHLGARSVSGIKDEAVGAVCILERVVFRSCNDCRATPVVAHPEGRHRGLPLPEKN